jgi:hypothetical protein
LPFAASPPAAPAFAAIHMIVTPAERTLALRRGLVALRAVEARRRATLPPGRAPAARLRELHDLAALADRIDDVLRIAGDGPDAVWARDASLTVRRDPEGTALVAALAAVPHAAAAPAAEEGEALRTLAALLARYDAGEFLPPHA